MGTRTWLTGVAAGALIFGGAVVANPFVEAAPLVGAVMQDATPSADDDDDEGEGTPVVGTPLLEPEIDIIQAQEAALEGQDGASVVSVELEGDDGTLVYEVNLDNGMEVEVASTSGEVIETEQSDDEADDEDDDAEDEDD